MRPCLDKTEGLTTTGTHLPAHTWKCQRPPKSCGCCQLLCLVSGKKSMQMDTGSSIHPQRGVTAWGSAGNPSAVSWESCHPDAPRQRGSQESRRQDHGKLICLHLEISVMYLQKTYLYFERFHSCHLFSPSVYGKALFKLCKTNLVYHVLEVPGWVLVK